MSDQSISQAIAYAWSPERLGEPHKLEISAQLESMRNWANLLGVVIAEEFTEVTGSSPTYRPKLEQAIDRAKELRCILVVLNYSIFGKILPQSTLWERKVIDAHVPVYFSEGGYLDPDMTDIREALAKKETQRRSDATRKALSDPEVKERVIGSALKARKSKKESS